MHCPACSSEMFVLEFEQVEIDFCPECKGVWLDSGELELVGARAGVLLSRLGAALASQDGHAPSSGEKRPCPVCGKRMLEVTTDGEPEIVLDRCSHGHGLWFDSGELGAVVDAAGADKDNVLARFFAELG